MNSSFKNSVEDFDEEIGDKTLRGVSALVFRNFLLQPISFLGFFFLSIFLQRWELGIFWAISEIIALLGYFSDIGLAAAIIQKKEKPKEDEIRAVFTLQQILVLFLITCAIILTPFLQRKFNFDDSGKVLFYSLLFGFFAASLKTIPSVLLERSLKFEKLATVDLVEQIFFTGLAVFFAYYGFGILSWVMAVVVRSLVGLILVYIFSPWPVGFNFHFRKIKHLIKFGVPFQLNSFLAVLKDRLVNIFLWGVLGSEGIGILGWAQKWAQLPLRFLMDAVTRVTFPAYSRLQSNKEKLSLALERSVFFNNLLIFPVLGGMAIIIPKIIEVFSKYHKWQVAIVPLWFYLANFAFGAATTPLINAFNAVGKIKVSLKLMIFWTILTWFLIFPFAKNGVSSVARSLFLVSLTSVIVWFLAAREFRFSLWKAIFTPFLFSGIMTLFLLFIKDLLPDNFFGILGVVFWGLFIYSSLIFVFIRKDLFWFFKKLSFLLRKKK